MDPWYPMSKVLEIAREDEKQNKQSHSVVSKEANKPTLDWQILLENRKLISDKQQENKQAQSWRESSAIIASKQNKKRSKGKNKHQKLKKLTPSKSSVSILLTHQNVDQDKPTSSNSTHLKQSNDVAQRSQSNSFASNDAFYLKQNKQLIIDEKNMRLIKQESNDDMIHKNSSMSILAQTNNWPKMLRHDSSYISEYNAYKSSKNMLFDLKNNSKTSKMISKKQSDKSKKIKISPLQIEERNWLKVQSDHWRRRRGYVSSTTAPVSKDDFHHLFKAFQIASQHKKRNNEPFISDKDIKNIALRLGINCSDGDARKMADIFDEDGSRHVTFPEMINVMNRAKVRGNEPLLGSGITLQQLLIANRRRHMLDDILRHHKKHNLLNHNIGDKKHGFSNHYGTTKRQIVSRNDTLKSIQERNNKTRDMNINMQNIEAEEYLRQRQQFDEKTRNPLTCKYCFKEFDYSHILEAHQLEKHEYKHKYFTCYQCSQTWIPISQRNNHNMKHVLKTNANSDGKNKIKNNKNNSTIMDRFKCQYCKLVFPSRQVLSFHHSQQHRPLSLDIFRCTYCDDSFDTYKKVLKHKRQFHSNNINDFKNKNGNSRSGVGQEFMDAIAQLDDYDSDNDMSPEEYQEMSKLFHASESRRMLKHRVDHLGHILDFRATHNMPDRTVNTLKALFDKQDQIKKTKNLLHVTSLLTSKFSEVVTEDESQTCTETISF